MEYAFSIIMFALCVIICIYALLVYPGRFEMIPRGFVSKTTDKRAYAKSFAKLLFIVALAPLISGIAGLICVFAFENDEIAVPVSFGVLIIAFVLCLIFGIKRLDWQ